MTKDIVGRLREYLVIDPYKGQEETGRKVARMLQERAEAADLIETLSPPDGVGLTRYELVGTGGDLTAHGWPNPEGEWVLYEDAAAVIAALTIANDTVAGLAIKLSDARAALAAEKARGEPDDWGADGAKWAAAFQETAIRLGYSDMDEGWLIGWFANAIERGRVAHPDTKRERATIAERDRRIAELEAGLKSVLDACDQGRMMVKPGCGIGGMTIEANIRGSIYSGVPAWPIEEARALLSGQQDTGGAHG